MYVLSKKLDSYYFGISSSCALCWKECCNEHNCETFSVCLIFEWPLIDPLDKHIDEMCLNTFPIGLQLPTYLPTYIPKEGS